MSLWGSKDQANNAPKYKITDRSPNTGIQLYGTRVFGLGAGETSSGKIAHAGWVRIIYGRGPVTNITVNAGGTGYSNADTVRLSGGYVNATATMTTNSTGGITSVVLTNGGSGFTNVASITTGVANSSGGNSVGTGAIFNITLGGRSNRIRNEVLVAMNPLSGNGSSVSI